MVHSSIFSILFVAAFLSAVDSTPFQFASNLQDLKATMSHEQNQVWMAMNLEPNSNSAVKYMKDILSGSFKLSVIIERNNENEDIDSVLSRMRSGAMLVVIPGPIHTPQPSAERFTIEVSPESQRLLPIASHMQRIYSLLDTVFPQQLLPMNIAVRELKQEVGVVFDIAFSRIILNEKILKYLDNTNADKLAASYDNFIEILENATSKIQKGDSILELLQYLTIDFPSLIGTSVLACVSCVLVLSVLFPYVVNYVLVNLALAICRELGWATLSSYCVALWTSAVALGLMSLPALGYIIFNICQVQQCANSL